MPLVEGLKSLHFSDIVDEKGADGTPEEQWCYWVEFLLTQRVPDLDLGPLVARDIKWSHWQDLANTSRG